MEAPTDRKGTITERFEENKEELRLYEEKGGAPLMVVFAVLLTVGVIVSFAMKANVIRLITRLTCSAGALSVLLLQMALKFPIVRDAATAAPVPPSYMYADVRYTMWFWLALVTVSASPLLVWLEWRRDRRRTVDEDKAFFDSG